MDLKNTTYEALSIFIKYFRLYIIDLIKKSGQKDWQSYFRSILNIPCQKKWDDDIRGGVKEEELIDWSYLKPFAFEARSTLLKNDFGRKANNLPTWLDEICEVRNLIAHQRDVDDEDLHRCIGTMIRISQMANLKSEEELRAVREKIGQEEVKGEKTAEKSVPLNTSLIPWFRNVRPHDDIQKGILDESVFAANLAEVASGKGREVYTEPETFFSKTYFTAGLKNLARRIIKGLNGKEVTDNRVISLQTGFGGGKTHSLISLFHLARMGKNIEKSAALSEILGQLEKPTFAKANVAVFTNNTNDPVQGREIDGRRLATLWGELAWQLGGKDAYEIVRKNDEKRVSPKGLFKKVLEKCAPSLILVDELADYCVAASGVKVGDSTLADQTISFIQELTEAVAESSSAVLVATLPASVTEVANSPKAQGILDSLSKRLSRVGVDTKPVDDEEIFEVIRRRLFEDIGDRNAIETVIDSYNQLYYPMVLSNELPDFVSKVEYREKMKKSYPFHPELIDIFRLKWASYPDFQRTRGVLRLLAAIVSDLWKRRNNLGGNCSLILPCDVTLGNLDPMVGQITQFAGNGFEAVISADISGHSSNSYKIDSENAHYSLYNLAQGISTTILLGTFEAKAASKGMSVDEIKLCCLKPQTFNHNDINAALDKLEGKAHFLYYSSTGSSYKKYWFHTKPNLNILINQIKSSIAKSSAVAKVLEHLERYSGQKSYLKVLINPGSEIPEQKTPTLVVFSPDNDVNPGKISKENEDFIKNISTKIGGKDRQYRNTIIFIAPSKEGANKLISEANDLLACEKVLDEYTSQLEPDQKKDMSRKLSEAREALEKTICDAYSIVLKYSAKNGITKLVIDKFGRDFADHVISAVIPAMIDNEKILKTIGKGCLVENNLFPEPQKPVRIRDVYEAFVRYDDKPMIIGQEALVESIQRYCQNGIFAVGVGEAGKYSKCYHKDSVKFLDVFDENFWIIDPGDIPYEESIETDGNGGAKEKEPGSNQKVVGPDVKPEIEAKTINKLCVSGKVPLEQYTQIFPSFIMPLTNNKVKIEIKISAINTESNPITENSQSFKVIKESAKQLDLDLEIE